MKTEQIAAAGFYMQPLKKVVDKQIKTSYNKHK